MILFMNLTVAEEYLALHAFGYRQWCWHRAPHGSSCASFRKQHEMGQQVLMAQALTVPQPKQYAERQYVTVYLEGSCGGDYNCGHFHQNPLGLWSFALASLGKAKMIERTTNVKQKMWAKQASDNKFTLLLLNRVLLIPFFIFACGWT